MGLTIQTWQKLPDLSEPNLLIIIPLLISHQFSSIQLKWLRLKICSRILEVCFVIRRVVTIETFAYRLRKRKGHVLTLKWTFLKLQTTTHTTAKSKFNEQKYPWSFGRLNLIWFTLISQSSRNTKPSFHKNR